MGRSTPEYKQGFKDGVAAVRAEILGIPHWRDSATGAAGFDLQPMGPYETSEEGAFQAVIAALDNVRTLGGTE